MRGYFNFLFGRAIIEISGRIPERFLNICSREEIRFNNLEKLGDNMIRLSVSRGDIRRAEEAALSLGLVLNTVSERGIPLFLRRFKKRYVLYFMPLISILAALYASFFIWEIDVSGNVTVSTGEILAVLEEAGVGIGTFGQELELELIRNAVLCELPKLSWLTVNVSGCRAEVIVRERRDKPELIDEKTPTEVLASKAGVITEINVYAGRAAVKAGDTVIPGELLISGTLDSKLSGTRNVHAIGEVFARTWYELSSNMPLEYITKSYTGENNVKKSVLLGNFRVNLYNNGGNQVKECDKITVVERLDIGGFLLPLSIVKMEYREYVPELHSLEVWEAEEILKDRLLVELAGIIGEAELRSTDYECSTESGVVTVTLRAECLEQIGVVSEIN